MKMYFQTANEKKVFETSDINVGAMRFIIDLIVQKRIDVIGHVVIASDYGFIDDIIAIDNRSKLEEMQYVFTYDVLKALSEVSPSPDESAKLLHISELVKVETERLAKEGKIHV